MNHHRKVGVEHFYLFFDDPNDRAVAVARRLGCTVILNDRKRQRSMRSEMKSPFVREFCQIYEIECQLDQIMVRQALNCDRAIRLALEAGYDWIAHIDCDELISSRVRLSRLVEQVPLTAGSFGLRPWEGVPEKMVIKNCFEEVSLFKTNPQQLKLSARAQRVFDRNFSERPFFVSYRSFKSIGRVGPDLKPFGVHRFKNYDGETNYFPKNARILHYPQCGFRQFMSKLENHSVSRAVRRDLEKRSDLFAQSFRAKEENDLPRLRKIYRNQIAIFDPVVIDELMSARIVERHFP